MKIDIDNGGELHNHVSSYSTEQIVVNNTTYYNSFILFPDKILADWPVGKASDLTIEDFQMILDLAPEIILFGSGMTIIFPDPGIIANIQNLNIGFEVMDTMAACRSYNILLSEKRRVAAALLIGK